MELSRPMQKNNPLSQNESDSQPKLIVSRYCLLASLLLILLSIVSPSMYAQEFNQKDSEYYDYNNSQLMYNNIAEAYGYYKSQELVIEKIVNHYPELKPHALGAKIYFDQHLGAINHMDKYASDNSAQWLEIKNRLEEEIPNLIDPSIYESKESAFSYLNIVQSRAKGEGDMRENVYKTLLAFSPTNHRYPITELASRTVERIQVTRQSQRSKGVSFSYEIPRSWLSSPDNERPNIIHRFKSDNGMGHMTFMTMVLDFGNYTLDSDYVRNVSKFPNILEWLPVGSTYDDSGYMEVEGLPGMWITTTHVQEIGRTKLESETLTFYIFDKNKAISIHAMVNIGINGNTVNSGGIERYSAMLDQIIASLVVDSRYH